MMSYYPSSAFVPLPHGSAFERSHLLLRADLNVPVTAQGDIADDFRLQSVLPTVAAVYAYAASSTLVTHMTVGTDRHRGTALLADWFAQRGYHAPRLCVAPDVRSDPRDYRLDGQGCAYARELRGSAAWYIFDAFASAHKQSASLTVLPCYFPRERRVIGLRTAYELARLASVRDQPKRPVVVIMGGGKGATKVPLVAPLLRYADTVLLCPALTDPFINPGHLQAPLAQSILASDYARGLILPIDYIPYAIGPHTLALWKPYIAGAGTIIFNGPMGITEDPASLVMRRMLLSAVVESSADIVVGGGDTMQLIHEYRLATRMHFCSTGGGAFLSYLAGSSLPALDALLLDSYDRK